MGEWKTSKIKDLAEVKGGKRLPKGKQLTSIPTKHPYIRIRDLGKSKYLELNSEIEFVDDETQLSITRYIVNTGDILISVVGTIGLIGIVGESLNKANQTENCDKIINCLGVEPEYLYYYLISPFGQEEIKRGTVGAVQPKLPLKNVLDINIKYPAIDEQRKIVDILKKIDEKICINERINNNLELQAQTIFVNMFAGNKTVVPATIADIALNVTDGVHNTVHDDPEGEFLLLSCKNIKGGTLNIGSSERRISSDTFEKLRRRTKLSRGDVLISSVGTVGELLLLNKEPSNYEFQRSVAMVKPNPDIVSPAYLYESLLSQKTQLVNAAHGAVQQCLFISDIAGFPIGIPQREELYDFDATVSPLFDMISANEDENQRLAEMRDILLPKLMSGELDVSNLML